MPHQGVPVRRRSPFARGVSHLRIPRIHSWEYVNAVALIFRCIFLERKLDEVVKNFFTTNEAMLNRIALGFYEVSGRGKPECQEDILNLGDEVTFSISGEEHKGRIQLSEPCDGNPMNFDNPFEIIYFCNGSHTQRRIRLDYVQNIRLVRHNNVALITRYNSIEELKDKNLL